MKDLLLLVVSGALAALGFAALALSQQQHWAMVKRAGKAARPPAGLLRLCGALLLILAAIPAILRDGAAFGLLVWSGLLTVSALLVVVFLTRRHRRADGAPDDRQ